MAQSSIITGQYVEITQTPASVGDRMLGALIDVAILMIYSTVATIVLLYVGDSLTIYDVGLIIALVLIYFPVILYNPLCEIFARGQSVGKMVMKTRVVTTDGNAPTVGSCLLRWLLYPIDTYFTGCLGILFIVFGKHRQRLGDLVAGTMVIKTTSGQYDFFSVNDFNYVQQGYVPTYPEAADLSSRQIDVITRTLYTSDISRRSELTYKLAVQVQQYLGVRVPANIYADVFLKIVLNDFYYYSSTIKV